MNLQNLITGAQELAGRVDPNYNERTRKWINEGQSIWVSRRPWSALTREEDIQVGQGQKEVVLPQRCYVLRWIADKTNKCHIRPHSQLDRAFPSTYFGDGAGRSDFFKRIETVPVAAQPTVAANVQVALAQNESVSVYIAGLAHDTTASGTANEFYFAEETLSLSTTALSTSAKKYIRIDTFSKSATSAGDVRLLLGGSTLSRIEAHEFSAEYRKVILNRPTDVAKTLRIEYVQKPQPLVETYQHPHPSIDVEFLKNYAAHKIHQSLQQPELAQEKRSAAESILLNVAGRETGFGDQDYQIMPDMAYWNDEDSYSWPDTL